MDETEDEDYDPEDFVVQRSPRADILLARNVRALLEARGHEDSSLAEWCGHRPAWISKILKGERGVRLVDLGRMADFFGLTVAQLFQHGISHITERRKHARRSGKDRRRGVDRRNPSTLIPTSRLGAPTHRGEEES